LGDGLRLLVKLAGPSHDVRECALIAGKEPNGRAQIDDHHGFNQPKCRRKDAAGQQLPRGKNNSAAFPPEVGKRRDQNKPVDPPGLRNQLEAHCIILRGLRSEARSGSLLFGERRFTAPPTGSEEDFAFQPFSPCLFISYYDIKRSTTLGNYIASRYIRRVLRACAAAMAGQGAARAAERLLSDLLPRSPPCGWLSR